MEENFERLFKLVSELESKGDHSQRKQEARVFNFDREAIFQAIMKEVVVWGGEMPSTQE